MILRSSFVPLGASMTSALRMNSFNDEGLSTLCISAEDTTKIGLIPTLVRLRYARIRFRAFGLPSIDKWCATLLPSTMTVRPWVFLV
jgi:hypothetical protein